MGLAGPELPSLHRCNQKAESRNCGTDKWTSFQEDNMFCHKIQNHLPCKAERATPNLFNEMTIIDQCMFYIPVICCFDCIVGSTGVTISPMKVLECSSGLQSWKRSDRKHLRQRIWPVTLKVLLQMIVLKIRKRS